MRWSFGLRALVGLAALSALLVFVGGAGADGLHGIGLAKGCNSTTKIGDPYTCNYAIVNSAFVDTDLDTLTVTSLVDTISTTPSTTSGNIIHDGALVAAGGATCTGGTGSGTNADPYLNSTSCTLPSGSSIVVKPFSFYTVQPADYNKPGHVLSDQVHVTWQDTCSSGAGNCPVGNQDRSTGSQTTVLKLDSSTATEIHSPSHQVVTTVAVGTTVHDKVTVTGQPGRPTPTGNVTIDWFLNGDCSGAPAVNSGSVGPLDASG